MTKKILLINDFSGYGKVAVSAMTPILIRQRYELFTLPTLIISNTLNYGKYASIDTTEYIKEALENWEQLGFSFDAVSTGFIANDTQAEYIANFCRSQSDKGVRIFTDPIMADNGKLYNSVNSHRVGIMKRIISCADYIFPNLTEACLLSDTEYDPEGYSEEKLYEIALKLNNAGSKSVIITSSILKNNKDTEKAIIGYDGVNDELFTVRYDELPFKINGSGDIFSAIVLSEILKNNKLNPAVIKAAEGIRRLISANADIAEEYNGLPVEASIELFDQIYP